MRLIKSLRVIVLLNCISFEQMLPDWPQHEIVTASKRMTVLTAFEKLSFLLALC